ncbi:MAG TPA: GNAT family protein [Rhodanobacteraceae bacterium]|jgi:RimJ/RimL family protein N-acetyltransferase|nr:GNAT family protein [Rhodanobacteraceae bacterium]
MQIVTARLRIDDLRPEDAAALFAYRSDPEVARYQGWQPAAVADAARFIEAQRGVTPDTPGSWWQRAIRLRDSGELIGDLGLHFVDADTVELGISLAPAQQHQGHARDVLELALDFVFGGLRKHRVIASVDPRNSACMRLLEGAGMRREAHFRASLRVGDGWADDVVFAMLETEWLAPADAEDR